MLARIFFILLLSVLFIGKSQTSVSVAEFTETGEIFSSEKNIEEPPGEEESFLHISSAPVYISIIHSSLSLVPTNRALTFISIKFPDRRGPPIFT
ncbi:hypothetical protein EHQ16_10380 [Leptospira kanakyensis]|uniref:Uncharacterized protein n=1 Tax=Leptospira kanakyensis TaxID=2484968 RepID=A0A6N4Q7G2_9LEPT|nr:hypothetical protein [Leptospira kanakyensis]TGK49302.1 hypothetical protein EHQ11_14810 [Leptospira kanakyensis]TGK60457.1 hypothetical protein EHQ16_10380 [Leptospira kanakyensis]TGK67855.1 hypothetical protein EHQ18_15180 [Leptospira kanakyensis]